MITAALPTYNNSDIIWIQLEALCNQKDAPDWELIICEESSDKYFGEEGITPYVERLQLAGCQRIVYLSLSQWVPLGQKWMIIRDNMHPKSVGMMLCASDNYSPNNRIELSYLAMRGGNDWFQCNSGYFFHLFEAKAGKVAFFDGMPGLFMCASAQRLKEIPECDYYPERGVDTWLMNMCRVEKMKCEKWTDGIHTDGLNTISLNRKLLYLRERKSGLFHDADPAEVFSLFSKEVQDRIKSISPKVKELRYELSYAG